ncbi:MAG: SDR family NAD(P)-dependent oxidoreductase [Gammaproteobacteria bacterium]|nr:SDR family NAD(P)-dependent oxidoreductase [Gammaproteobacteria bacterium]
MALYSVVTRDQSSRPGRIIITGASSGIGQAIAWRLSDPDTTIVNLDLVDGDGTAKQCKGRFHTVIADMGDAKSVSDGFRKADRVLEGEAPDLLVCCAALSRASRFLEAPLEDLDLMLKVNVRGTFLCCQEAGRRMAAKRCGKIVVITSLCAAQGWALESIYCVTKGAQQSIVQSAAVELAPFGILVNAVAPGIIENTGDSMAKTRTDPDVFRHEMERTPAGRCGTPAEVADAVHFLANVTWMTGQTLYLDGGFMATGLAYIGKSHDSLEEDGAGRPET